MFCVIHHLTQFHALIPNIALFCNKNGFLAVKDAKYLSKMDNTPQKRDFCKIHNSAQKRFSKFQLVGQMQHSVRYILMCFNVIFEGGKRGELYYTEILSFRTNTIRIYRVYLLSLCTKYKHFGTSRQLMTCWFEICNFQLGSIAQ